MELHGYDAEINTPSDRELAVIGGAVNYILALGIEKQVQMLGGSTEGISAIHSRAYKILSSDPVLEKLIIRLLYDIASLGELLKKDSWAQGYLREHSRIMEVLVPARDKYPELFRDVDESKFKGLFAYFVDKYLPDMKESTSALFG